MYRIAFSPSPCTLFLLYTIRKKKCRIIYTYIFYTYILLSSQKYFFIYIFCVPPPLLQRGVFYARRTLLEMTETRHRHQPPNYNNDIKKLHQTAVFSSPQPRFVFALFLFVFSRFRTKQKVILRLIRLEFPFFLATQADVSMQNCNVTVRIKIYKFISI